MKRMCSFGLLNHFLELFAFQISKYGIECTPRLERPNLLQVLTFEEYMNPRSVVGQKG